MKGHPHPLLRAAIVGAYVVVFYGALPASLWVAGAGLDRLVGWSWPAWPWAWGLLIPADEASSPQVPGVRIQ